MRVLVTGGNGFVGKAVARALKADGHEVIAGSRRGEGVEGARGVRLDVTDASSVRRAVADVRPEAVVHLVGIIAEVPRDGQTFARVHVEGTRNVVDALPSGTRYLHMSALGARPDSASGYSSSKGQAEDLVRRGHLAWTIFRPSLIFGRGDDFFGRVLKNLVSQAPVVPVIGDGAFKFRPVSAPDVARAFARALALPRTAGRSFDLTGPAEYRFDELLRLELAALGKKKPLVNVPLFLMNLAVPAMQLLPKPPITKDQYAMLLEGNTADPEPARTLFDLPMRRLEDDLPEIVGRPGAKLGGTAASGD